MDRYISKIIQGDNTYHLVASKVNGFTVQTSVPANAKLTDTTYVLLSTASTYSTADVQKGLVVPVPDEVAEGTVLNAQGKWINKAILSIASSYIEDGTNNSIKIGDVENNTTNGSYSVAAGQNLITSTGTTGQFVIGKFNDSQSNTSLFIVGNGEDDTNRQNCFEVTSDGDIKFTTTSTLITGFMEEGE